MTLPDLLGTRDRRLQLCMLVALGAVQAGLVLAGAALLRVALSGQGGAPIWALAIAAAFATVGVSALARARAEHFGQSYVAVCRVRLLKSMVRAPFGSERHGLAMTRMITDLSSIKTWVGQGIAGGATNAVFLLGLLAGAVWLMPDVLLPLFLAVALVATAGLALVRPLQRAIRLARSARGKLSVRIGEALLVLPLLRSHGRLDAEKSIVYRLSSDVSERLSRRHFLATVLRTSPEAGVMVALFALVSSQGGTQAVVFGPALVILTQVGRALRGLARVFDHWLTYREGRARLDQAFANSGAKAQNWTGRGPLAVRFEKCAVSVGHRRATLRIGQGARVVCDPGHEMAEVLRAVAGLRPVSKGALRIEIGNESAPKADRLAGAAILVAPDVPLRRGSVAQALRDGRPSASRKLLRRLLVDFGVASDDAAAAEVLRSPIGEAGRGVPPGFGAQLRLLRALLARPGILIVDDPVFETDPEAMAMLRQVLETVDATVLVTQSLGQGENGPHQVLRVANQRLQLSAAVPPLLLPVPDVGRAYGSA